MGFGGPHAGYLAVHTKHARQLPGPAGRGVQDADGVARVPAVAADPRAAHPPRQGHQQHLHRAGAARGDRRDVRQLSRCRRAGRDRAPGARPRTHAGRRAVGGRRRAWCTTGSSTPCWPVCRAGPQQVRAEAKSRGINVWLVDDDHVSVSCDEATTDDHVGWRCSKPFGGDSRLRRVRRPRHRHQHLGVPHPSGVHPVSHRDRDDALPAVAGRQGYRVGPQHDSARLVHDEAQRRRRDGADHLARVRPPASVRAALGHAGAAQADRRPGDLADRR